ncbi:hypothetical protein CAEBREN_06254 [Caenorhabditis brenneri]|uniref:Lin-15A/B-like domain-containing protein n=1 Tax=Caenorhabditis brenneri TaxID=135651 RepID=G0N192_CAEBE|nr:hypothetical protein CAEBREN_06254 [Caenorhabditis brenneri]
MDEEREIKKEPLDDDDCIQNSIKTELVEPKKEEPDDYEEMPPNDIVEPRVKEQPVYLKLETTEYPEIIDKILKIQSAIPRLRTLRCAVCSESVHVKNTTRQASKTRQLFLLAGLVLCGRISMEKAQLLYSKRTFTSCKVHVLEAMEEIFRVLKIKNLQTRWAKESMETLMNTVRELHPEHSFDRIYPLLLDFNRKADTIRQDHKMDQDMRIIALMDHDYCLPNPIKTELVEPKIEELDYIEMPPEDFIEQKIEEPDPRQLEHMKLKTTVYHEAPPKLELVEPKSEKLEEQQQSQESVLFEPKLEEPNCDEDYPEYIKLEPVDDSNEHSGLSERFQRRKCVACSQLQPAGRIIVLKSKSRKIFLVVGLMFIGKRTVEETREWYHCPIFYICRTHVTEAVNSIFEVLNVRTVNEIETCSMESRETLMATVNLLEPNHKMDQDMRIIALMDHDYCLQNPIKTELVEPKIEELDYIELPPEAFIKEPEPVLFEPKLEEPDCDEAYPEYIKLEPVDDSNEHSSPKPKKTQNRKCRICSCMVAEDETTNVTQKSRLLVLMTGLVVGNRTTVEDARYWMYENSSVFLICKAHQEEAVKGILSFLNIRKLDEMTNRSTEKTQRLMQIVRDMDLRHNFSAFVNFLLAFVLKMDSKEAYLGTLGSAFQSWKCVTCSQLQPADRIIAFNTKPKKIFLVVGLMLISKITLEEAQQWYDCPIFHICRTHVTEAVNSIFEVLNVKTVNEIKWCTMKNHHKMDQDMRNIALMDHDYCLPNPIKTELVEPKIEELDYIKMPSDGFIEAPEPVLFEPKLEEPDCDEDYPKYIKLEPVDDSNEHSAPKPKEPRNRVCRICFYAVAENETINVTQKSQLLILMTGLVVENRTALQDARYWMYENPPVFLICKAHQEEAVKGILSFLNIRKLDEMTTRSEAKTQRLMEIVRDMGRRLKFSAFVNSLLAFVLEMDSKDAYLGNLSSALRSWKCMACSQLQPDNKIIFCNMKTRKIFLIVGLVFSGKIKVEEAQLFYHSPIFPICRTHVTEAVNSICDVLNVETVNGMKWSCTENRETLMSVVNLLVPSMSFSNFSANLKNFIQNN